MFTCRGTQEVVRRGVVDPARVAVGGHSYGAFMAANLLAHAPDLFACGIAKSGAYNRTLTPFGFQSEERTLWQAPEVYSTMSPFNQVSFQPLHESRTYCKHRRSASPCPPLTRLVLGQILSPCTSLDHIASNGGVRDLIPILTDFFRPSFTPLHDSRPNCKHWRCTPPWPHSTRFAFSICPNHCLFCQFPTRFVYLPPVS